MKAFLLALCLWVLIFSGIMLATSCTFTVGADGSKSGTLSGEAALRAIEILSEK